MRSKLTIELTDKDCIKMWKDLEKVSKFSGFCPETYLLLNRIRLFRCGYDEIEE